MAGDWIPIRIDLADEPEVIAIGDELGIDYDMVVGKLVRLWGWANRTTADGNARRVTQKWVDARVSAPGFAKAMADVGWLTIAPTGIEFPRFDVWNSQSGKQRILGAKRAAAFRQNQGQKSNDAGVTIALPTEQKRIDSSLPAKPPREKKPKQAHKRPPDELFDAVAQITASDPKSSGSHIGRVCRDLRASDSPYTVADVKQLASILEKRGFTLPITLGTVSKYIGWTRDEKHKVQGKTLEQIAADVQARREKVRLELEELQRDRKES